jgi:hypothetical protein
MKLIKCEGEITTINGRSFRKPCVGERIPKGHLRRSPNGAYWLPSVDAVCIDNFDLVEVPTPIGEPFEAHGEWWQEIESCDLERSTTVLLWGDHCTKKVSYVNRYHGALFNHIAIPCDAPAVQTRPMTWGEAWDRDLWIKDHLGQIVSSKSYSRLIHNDVYDDLFVSQSHRGPWYPAVMPWEGDKC